MNHNNYLLEDNYCLHVMDQINAELYFKRLSFLELFGLNQTEKLLVEVHASRVQICFQNVSLRLRF